MKNATNGTLGTKIKSITELEKLIDSNSMVYLKKDESYIGYKASHIAQFKLATIRKYIINSELFNYKPIKI